MADVKALADIVARQTTVADADLFFVESGGTPAGITHENLKTQIPGRLLGVQSFDAAGAFTYTPTTGTKLVLVKLVAAGGGGGGADGDADNEGGAGAGAASGGTIWALFRVNDGNTYSGVIGAGGTAGSQSSNGGTGGDTTFANAVASRLNLSAPGGLGGESASDINTNTSSGGNAPTTNTRTGTDLLWSTFIRGSDGSNGTVISKQDVSGNGTASGGNGGPSSMGGAGRGLETDGSGESYNGRDGNTGGGGGGGVALDNTSVVNGGEGGKGYAEFMEFS